VENEEAKAYAFFLREQDASYRFSTNGKHQDSSLFVLHSSLYLVSSSAQSVVEVHDSLHLVEVVSNL
jgi:hypothetical protein